MNPNGYTILSFSLRKSALKTGNPISTEKILIVQDCAALSAIAELLFDKLIDPHSSLLYTVETSVTQNASVAHVLPISVMLAIR